MSLMLLLALLLPGGGDASPDHLLPGHPNTSQVDKDFITVTLIVLAITILAIMIIALDSGLTSWGERDGSSDEIGLLWGPSRVYRRL